jgi:hypothetical protein
MRHALCILLLCWYLFIGNLEKCGIQHRHEHQGQHGRKSQAEHDNNCHGHKETVLQQRDHTHGGGQGRHAHRHHAADPRIDYGLKGLGGGIGPGCILLELQFILFVRGGGKSSGSLNFFFLSISDPRYDIFWYTDQNFNLGYLLEG